MPPTGSYRVAAHACTSTYLLADSVPHTVGFWDKTEVSLGLLV